MFRAALPVSVSSNAEIARLRMTAAGEPPCPRMPSLRVSSPTAFAPVGTHRRQDLEPVHLEKA